MGKLEKEVSFDVKAIFYCIRMCISAHAIKNPKDWHEKRHCSITNWSLFLEL